MGAFEYESQLADLTNRYNSKSATDDYAHMVSQQRFGRQRRDMTEGYQQAFPKFTGAWAGRLGSGIQSGVFRRDLTQQTNNFNRALGDLDQDEAGEKGQYEMMKAQDTSGYQKMLLALQEGWAKDQAAANIYGPGGMSPAPAQQPSGYQAPNGTVYLH